MELTDNEVAEYIRHILYQNRKSRLIFRKIVDMLSKKEDNFEERKFTVVSVQELERLRDIEKISAKVCELSKQMVHSLGLKGNFEKKEQIKSDNR